MATRSKLAREDIKWQELLQHFRSVQAKHEKARRLALGNLGGGGGGEVTAGMAGQGPHHHNHSDLDDIGGK